MKASISCIFSILWFIFSFSAIFFACLFICFPLLVPYEKCSELLKYICSLQESGIELTIHWKILSDVRGMTKRGCCSLCLTEKLCQLHYFDDMHFT